MATLLAFACALVLAAGVLSLAWRLASRRRAIPCPSWLSGLVELDNPLFRNTHASVILEHLDLKPGMTAMDVGCGPGRITIPMAKIVGSEGRVVAVDSQAGMLEKVAAKAKREGLTNIEYRLVPGTGRFFEFGPVNRAVLSCVLGEVPDHAALLKAIFDTLSRGGVLAVAESIADPHFQSQTTVRNLAKEVGFFERSLVGGRFSYTMYLEKA